MVSQMEPLDGRLAQHHGMLLSCCVVLSLDLRVVYKVLLYHTGRSLMSQMFEQVMLRNVMKASYCNVLRSDLFCLGC